MAYTICVHMWSRDVQLTLCTMNYSLHRWHVITRAVDDDILLEVVMFVGILCNEGTAPMLVDAGLVSHQLACPCMHLLSEHCKMHIGH